MRNLLKLDKAAPQPRYNNFFTANADSIWNKARGPGNQLSQVWSGPFGGASAGTQSSALDAIIAAASSDTP